MKSIILSRVARAFTLASLVASATAVTTIPARSQDVGAYLQHICECKWLILTDLKKHSEQCGPFQDADWRGSLSPPNFGPSSYTPPSDPDPEPEQPVYDYGEPS